MHRSTSVLSIVLISFLLISTSFGTFSSQIDENSISSASYSPSQDTIYVRTGGNTLQSVALDVNNDSVIRYDGINETTYCYSNLTVEGSLQIKNETLYMDDKRTLKVNSTGDLYINGSKVAGAEEEKYWWESENRFSIVKENGGLLKIRNSEISDTGWSGNIGERGFEVYGGDLTIRNSTISGGLNGLIFNGAGDMGSSTIDNVTLMGMDEIGVMTSGGVNQVILENCTLRDNGGKDMRVESQGNLTIINSTYEDWTSVSEGYIEFEYITDLSIINESGPLPSEPVTISYEGGESHNYTTNSVGKIKNIPLIWRKVNETRSERITYGLEVDGKETYFSPSNYNHLTINTSRSDRLWIHNVSVRPSSYVPINNDWEPHNITLRAVVQNNMSVPYDDNLTFYYSDIQISRQQVNVPSQSQIELSTVWTPDVEGYSKIKAEIEQTGTMTQHNHRAWSNVFFAGYYNETITPYENKMEKALQMMEWGVKNEDADGYYTIYQDWALSVLMEMGVNYFAAYDITGNYSYHQRAEKQLDYVLGFRDQWGLFNRTSDAQTRGRFKDTYYEWSTHRNVRSALALQQAYLYTRNQTYLNYSDHVIDFILNKVAMENITWHGGVNYTVPYESTGPNGGIGGVKGTSKDFPYVWANAYIQLGRLLTQAYYDKNLNSSYYMDDRLLPHINTCIKYILNDQKDDVPSKGTWPYFSYYREPINKTRYWMHYAALTAMELANTNVYLNWANITQAVSNYTDYIERHLSLRTAIDTNHGGSGRIETYVFLTSLYNTTHRNVSKIEDFMYSNIFFNDNGTVNGFEIDSDIYLYDPTSYGFLYVHYNPLRTLLWDRYYEDLSSRHQNLSLKSTAESDGWNFISTKLVPNDTNINSILNDPINGISGNYDRVMFYKAKEDKWCTYVPGRSFRYNDLLDWDHTMGIWIHMVNNDILPIEGRHPYRTVLNLQPGWNMIGYPSDENRIAQNVFPSDITKIGVFNESKYYNIRYRSDLTNITISSGNGYWVYNNAETTVKCKIDY